MSLAGFGDERLPAVWPWQRAPMVIVEPGRPDSGVVAAGRLDERAVTVAGPPELRRLAGSFNTMGPGGVDWSASRSPAT